MKGLASSRDWMRLVIAGQRSPYAPQAAHDYLTLVPDNSKPFTATLACVRKQRPWDSVVKKAEWEYFKHHPNAPVSDIQKHSRKLIKILFNSMTPELRSLIPSPFEPQ